MKARLNFDLEDEDDRYAYAKCNKATDMALAIFEIQYNLRRKIEAKIENSTEEPSAFTVLDWVFDELNDELSSINIDELIV